MKKLIVSTCGTSLFTNGATPEETSALRATANDDAAQLRARPEATVVNARMAERAKALAGASSADARKWSAELNGLISYPGAFEGGTHHIFLVTDTAQGRAAGEAVAAWVRVQGGSSETRVLEELTTADLGAFHRGMSDFSAFCRDTLSVYRTDGCHIAFNLVGGFKTLVAYGVMLGMVWADELTYVFEGPGSPLLRIPKIPVSLAMDGTLREHVTTVRRLAGHLAVAPDELERLPEAVVYRIGDEADLSPWASRDWAALRPELYGAALLPSPSPKVVYGQGFAKSVSGLPTDRTRIVNERIDDLARWAEAAEGDKQKLNLRRLDVKPVKGGKPGTFECDAWSDKDARRLFFAYDAGVAVLDRLDRALH